VKKILFVVLTSLIYAQTVTKKDVDKLLKTIDSSLKSEKFWEKIIKNDNVKYGYFRNKRYILFCNKKKKTLQVFKYNHGKLKTLAVFKNIIVGKLGDKRKEGDLKTPIGVYYLIKKFTPSNTFYGPLAFVTSYPNLFDKVQNKDGYGIWIHGKPLDGERGDTSKGCIVLNNNDILTLDNLINYKKTTLEITQSPLIAKKKDIAKILALVYRWKEAWRKCDIDKYLSFYDKKNFRRSNGMDFKQFSNYKKLVFANKKGQNIKIYFKNIKVVPYQNIKNLPIYQVSFHEDYISPTYQFHGYKEIYLQKEKNGFKIIIEK